MTKIWYLNILCLVVMCSCSGEKQETSGEVAAQESITAEDMEHHIATLASDAFQGRKPFTEGEEKTVTYLEEEFQQMGLEPGNGDSYFQEVPLVEIDAVPEEMLSLRGKNKKLSLTYKKDFVALTRRVAEEVKIDNSELVFAGYGIVAPEYNWNDYAGIDWKGKTAVVLVNDPGFGAADSTFFKGNTMTYYGRWTYKYEEAARQGADGILIIHADAPAGYPWAVVQTGWVGKNLYLKTSNNNNDRCALEGWITEAVANKILQQAGQTAALLDSAKKPGFTPVPLGLSYSMTFQNTIANSVSKNVIAKITGSEKPDEYIIYTAHWDHMGIGAPVNGDSIYNGAIDNASGVAAIMEIAEAFKQLSEKQHRTMVFLAVTAEEQGLLGSEYYVKHPIYPLENTVANLNIDALQYFGAMKDLTVIGYGQSELDDYATRAAKKQDRYIHPDPSPQKGHFFRSDHFNFAKVGVPALYAKGEYEQAENDPEWTAQQNEAWDAEHYHQPSDQLVSGEWDFAGMVQDTRLMFDIGYQLSNESTFPNWKAGSEFKVIRDKAMNMKTKR